MVWKTFSNLQGPNFQKIYRKIQDGERTCYLNVTYYPIAVIDIFLNPRSPKDQLEVSIESKLLVRMGAPRMLLVLLKEVSWVGSLTGITQSKAPVRANIQR